MPGRAAHPPAWVAVITTTSGAPAAFRLAAQLRAVAEVVITSSTSSTGRVSLSSQAKAPVRFFSRASRFNPCCVWP